MVIYLSCTIFVCCGRGGHAWGGGGVASVAMATSSLQSVCSDILMKSSQEIIAWVPLWVLIPKLKKSM